MRTLYDNDKKYARAYRAMGVMSLYFILSVLTSGIYSASGIGCIGFGINALLFFAGYFLMSLWARLLKMSRETDSGGYEAEGGYFSLVKALAPMLVIGICGIFVMKLAAELEYRYVMNTPGSYYDADSILPPAVMLFFDALMICGVVVWFIPHERLISQKTMFTSVGVMFVAYVFYGYIGGGGAMIGLSLMGYILMMSMALNQQSLTRTYRGTVVAFLSSEARRYNLKLAGAFCLFTLLLMGGGYMVATGLSVIGKSILYMIVYSKYDTSSENYLDSGSSDERLSLFNLYVFGAKEADDTVNYYMFLVFIVLSVPALIIFLFRRQGEIRALIDAVKRLVLQLIDFIFSPISDSMTYFIANMREEEQLSYLDTEEKLTSSFNGGRADKLGVRRFGWREFSAGLRAAPNENEKLCYAYAVFARQLYKIPQFAKTGDTARELHRKLKRRNIASDDELAAITATFERAKYSADGADPREAAAATEKLCRIIRRSLED